jgi:hypothetical protein
MLTITRDQRKALVIVGIGWLLVLLYAWPGIMVNDSYDQLREGRAGFYTDGHPPFMSVLWRYLDKIVAGPALMYLLQTGTFFAGVYAFCRALYPPPRAATIAICIALFPPILAPMSVVWKDALMASCLVLGIAGLVSERRNLKIAGLVAFWFASAVRYNAAAATLVPIVLLFEWRPMRWYFRYGLAIALWIAITASSILINAALTDRPMYLWSSSIAVHDIAGTLANVDDTIPDAELRKTFEGTQIKLDKDIHQAFRDRYKSVDFMPLVLGDKSLWDLPIMGQTPAPEPQRDAIERAWGEIVFGHPGAYLQHRLAVYHKVLGFPKKNAGLMVAVGRGQNRLFAIPMKIEHRPYVAQNWVQRHIVERVAYWTPLFRAWPYFFAAFVMLYFARKNRIALALLGSGLMLELSLFPLAASSDFRYSHWLVVSTVLAGIVLVHAGRSRGAG